MKMWRNAVGKFKRPLPSVYVYKKFVWVSGFIEMLINKYLKKSKKSEKNKIMIWRIHYFITKIKTKNYVIPTSCFNVTLVLYRIWCHTGIGLYFAVDSLMTQLTRSGLRLTNVASMFMKFNSLRRWLSNKIILVQSRIFAGRSAKQIHCMSSLYSWIAISNQIIISSLIMRENNFISLKKGQNYCASIFSKKCENWWKAYNCTVKLAYFSLSPFYEFVGLLPVPFLG